MDGTIDIDDPGNLALMEDATIVAVATMTASCIEAGLDLKPEAMVELLRELAKRLGTDDA